MEIHEFIDLYGSFIISKDILEFPKDAEIAKEYKKKGYILASVFKNVNGMERVSIDNSYDHQYAKTGIIILSHKI